MNKMVKQSFDIVFEGHEFPDTDTVYRIFELGYWSGMGRASQIAEECKELGISNAISDEMSGKTND